MSASKSPKECASWVQKVHQKHSQQSPEAWGEALVRIEQARQHEASTRKCKAAKGHAVRSRALAVESLRQMANCSAPEEHMGIQAKWKSAQDASSRRQAVGMRNADAALLVSASSATAAPAALLADAAQEEEEAMEEVAAVVGAADARSMAALGEEGVSGRVGNEPANDGGGAAEALLKQLRKEPGDEAECAAKFLLYEGYNSEVEQMRNTLLIFHAETRQTVPPAVALDMDKKVKSIDSEDAMGIPDDSREWFVYHMMRQAERNNLNMAAILDGFEKKLEFLASNHQNECPVCLEAFEEDGDRAPLTLSCCHKVCKDCWSNWSAVMHSQPFCPLCRHGEFLEAVAAHVSGARVPDSEDSS